MKHADRWLCLAVVLAAAFFFQGSRGIWEPDEGRYVSPALGMLQGGDWLIPRLQGLRYLDKPPAVYWTVALGMRVFGTSEWGARFGQAVALVLTAGLIGCWLRPVLGSHAAAVGAAVYATTLLVVIGANTVTPDGVLALCTTAAFVSYWRYRAAVALDVPSARWNWALLLGLAVGLGLFAKGTAAIVFAAPIVIHLVWEGRVTGALRRLEVWSAVLLSLAVGSAWYLWVERAAPGALAYLYDNQVSGRLWETSYRRNTQWWQPFRVYGAALILGSLPWSLCWIGVVRRRAWRRLGTTREADLFRFLLLATGLPLGVLSLAKSRLELYVLPLMAPLVVLTLLVTWREGTLRRWRWRLLAALVATVVVKAVGAYWHNPRDSRWLAASMQRAGARPESCIVVVDETVHGLRFYGFSRVFWVWTTVGAYPYYESPPLLGREIPRLARACRGPTYFLSERSHLELARTLVSDSGWSCGPARDTGRYWIARCSDPEEQSVERSEGL